MNVKLKSKALALILVFVFAVTSVINTGSVFATDTSGNQVFSSVKLTSPYYDDIDIDLTELEETKSTEIELSSEYAYDEFYLDVEPAEGYEIQWDEEDLDFLYFSLDEDESVTYTPQVKRLDDESEEAEIYTITIFMPRAIDDSDDEDDEDEDNAEEIVTLDANGGVFEDGEDVISVSADTDISDIEIPTRDGYIFVSWGTDNGDRVNDIGSWGDETIYAYWRSYSDTCPLYAVIKYNYGNDGYREEEIWGNLGDESNYSMVELPRGASNIILEVTYPNGEVKTEDITLDANGKGEKTIVSTSFDGTKQKKYKVELVATGELNVKLEYYNESEDDWVSCYGDGFRDDSTIDTIYLTKEYNGESLQLIVDDWDESEITKEVHLNADNTGTVSFESCNGKTYTINIAPWRASDSTWCDLEFIARNEEDSWSAYDSVWNDYIKNITMTIPYGMLSEDWNFELQVVPSYNGSVESFELIDDEENVYSCELQANGSKSITKPVTIIAEDGVTKATYNVTIQEDAGESTKLKDLEFRVSGNDDYSLVCDLDKAATKDGEDVIIPYDCTLDAEVELYYALDEGQTINHAKDSYVLNENGEATVEFTVTSANGKVSQDYKFNLKRDPSNGDLAELSDYTLNWMALNKETGKVDSGKIVANVKEAAEEGGTTVIVPNSLYTAGAGDMWGVATSKNYGTIQYNYIDAAGNEEINSSAGSNGWTPHLEDKTSDSVELTVISPNGKNKKTYKFTFIRSCDKHELSEWKIVKDATCTTAGEKEPIAAIGHKAGAMKVTKKATVGKAGAKESKCTVCGTTLKKETIAAVVTPKKVSKTYTGKEMTLSIKIKDTKGKVIQTVKMPTRKGVGLYSKKVTLKGEYSGTVTLYYEILPKTVSLNDFSAGKNSITVKWKQLSKTHRAAVSGFEIRYSTSSKMKSAKKVTVKGAKATQKTISKLKGKKRYYVQVRTYKIVDGKKYYSAWSSTKSIKTKK